MNAGLAESVLARIILKRNLIQAMDEHCKSISARATSGDKTVSVQVDGLGAVTGLWQGESAYRNGPDALAQLIVGTTRAAAQVALDGRSSHSGSTFPPRPPANE